ncbi:poly(A) polymerase 2, partial [Striga asiatica]
MAKTFCGLVKTTNDDIALNVNCCDACTEVCRTRVVVRICVSWPSFVYCAWWRTPGWSRRHNRNCKQMGGGYSTISSTKFQKEDASVSSFRVKTEQYNSCCLRG